MSFDFVAPVYDGLARLVFGRSLLRAQRAAGRAMNRGADVLVLGGGTGALLPQLLAQKQPRWLLYVEASETMLSRAQARVASNSPVEFRHGTETALRPGEQFDYIVLPFVLDLYPPADLHQHLLPRLVAALKPGGALLVTDFDRPRTIGQRLQFALMLLFFRLTARIPVRQWTDWPQALRRAGLSEQHAQLFRSGQVRSGSWVRSATAAPAPAARRAVR